MSRLRATFVLFVLLIFSGTVLAGGKSYSSGSKSYSKPSSSKSYSAPKVTPSKSYSNSSSSKSYSNSSAKSYSAKPKGNFQSLPAQEQKKAVSRTNYQKATAPKETYVTPKGNSVKINNADKKVVNIRQMDETKWVSRDVRVHTFYHSYVNSPVVYYNDPYSTFFWFWLLDRSLDDRAYWAYHHRSDMDEARYRDMLAKDAKLEARIKQLEAEKVVKDQGYLPPGMTDPDLPYTDEYVDAVVNPESKQVSLFWCCCPLFVICLTILVVWLVFFKRW